jgi:hypothetical protein
MAEGASASKDGAFHTLSTSLSGAADWIDEVELIGAFGKIGEAASIGGAWSVGGQLLMLTAAPALFTASRRNIQNFCAIQIRP